MKILDLRLIAFGPFTGRVLDLSAGNHGLHVIFGPNEAGKSCALRALHALLYGIPVQTNDAFLHPYGELRVGARLRLSSGDEIEFSRRKANRGSLLGPGDARLDDRALDRFLDGVGPDQFRMFWGIDYARLVEGGQEILKGQGDLGASLFAAGSGASHLGALRKKLDEEAVELFAPRGRNRVINQAVGHLRDLRSAQREATVSSEAWAGQDRAARDESYRESRRPHFLGGWGLWDVQVGFPRRCASVPSGWSRSTRGGPRLRVGGAAVGGAEARLHGGDAAEVGAAGAA